jgi:hypothetical protein
VYTNFNKTLYTKFRKTRLSLSSLYIPTCGQTDRRKSIKIKGEHLQHVIAIAPEMIEKTSNVKKAETKTWLQNHEELKKSQDQNWTL